ncbi:hypothetical protein [Microbulbifer hainanensis]|uniref:hypothetical protein n=1 Tax=Microbulbifer hainanensis TaxID=2735675 RepID=UPI00186721C9|nr:hypothetical protein [Microbulbifer hainanensis]
MNQAFEAFVQNLDSVDLFGSVGKNLIDYPERILSWDEWQGPECERVSAIHFQQQAYCDKLISEDQDLIVYWDKLLDFCLEKAKERVPFVEGEDVWYAPNIAAYHAAWTFALQAIFILEEICPPIELEAQWEWFEKGHWPAELSPASTQESPRYVVF